MSKRKAIKLSMLRRQLSDDQEWRMQLLGQSGFSYKFIISTVLGVDRGRINERDLALCSRVLQRGQVRVTDYRNGENDIGSMLARRLMKRKQAPKLAVQTA